jgi:hypothetical protein
MPTQQLCIRGVGLGSHCCLAVRAELASLVVSADAACLTWVGTWEGAAVGSIMHINTHIHIALACRNRYDRTEGSAIGNIICLDTAHV